MSNDYGLGIARPDTTDSSQVRRIAKKDPKWPITRRQSVDRVTDGQAVRSDTKRGLVRWIGGLVHSHVQRGKLSEDVPRTSTWPDTDVVNSVIPPIDLQDEKPIASGNGISMAIHLGEPVLFLQGFENAENALGNTAMLRGSLHLRVQKSAKIKAVTLKFEGKAVTKCLEGVAFKGDTNETDTIMSHTWPFFNAQFQGAEKGTNADHVQLFVGPQNVPKSANGQDHLGRFFPNASAIDLTIQEAEQLAPHGNKPPSFGNYDGQPHVAANGYRHFLPGDYIYNFELPLDNRLPETTEIKSSSVKYKLEAVIERQGVFQTNLVGYKGVSLIRVPAEGSLGQVEPIAANRTWDKRLRCELVISGRSFPLGSQVPIALKLTPLGKVQCHRIQVFLTENIKHFCSNERVHCMLSTRKVPLFDKRTGESSVCDFPGSSMRVTAGGGFALDARAREAKAEEITTRDALDLLGVLEDDTNMGPTEMEFNVQLPSCHTMTKKDGANRLHFDTTYKNIRVYHWIKVVLSLSKPDQNHPSKRRHSEISMDSPFRILSCRATHTNISLPAYDSPHVDTHCDFLHECGCPGAAKQRHSPASFVPTLNALNSARTGCAERPRAPTIQSSGLARQQQAQVHAPLVAQRPMHMLPTPSSNPPAITPPPQYDDIASPTHGLTEYFSRLSDAHNSDSGCENYGSGSRHYA